MREMSVREANQNFSSVIAAAERGETIIITKNGTPVAKVSPQPADRTMDPAWQAAYQEMVKCMRETPATGFRVGTIAEADKYGDDPA